MKTITEKATTLGSKGFSLFSTIKSKIPKSTNKDPTSEGDAQHDVTQRQTSIKEHEPEILQPKYSMEEPHSDMQTTLSIKEQQNENVQRKLYLKEQQNEMQKRLSIEGQQVEMKTNTYVEDYELHKKQVDEQLSKIDSQDVHVEQTNKQSNERAALKSKSRASRKDKQWLNQLSTNIDGTHLQNPEEAFDDTSIYNSLVLKESLDRQILYNGMVEQNIEVPPAFRTNIIDGVQDPYNPFTVPNLPFQLNSNNNNQVYLEMQNVYDELPMYNSMVPIFDGNSYDQQQIQNFNSYNNMPLVTNIDQLNLANTGTFMYSDPNQYQDLLNTYNNQMIQQLPILSTYDNIIYTNQPPVASPLAYDIHPNEITTMPYSNGLLHVG